MRERKREDVIMKDWTEKKGKRVGMREREKMEEEEKVERKGRGGNIKELKRKRKRFCFNVFVSFKGKQSLQSSLL